MTWLLEVSTSLPLFKSLYDHMHLQVLRWDIFFKIFSSFSLEGLKDAHIFLSKKKVISTDNVPLNCAKLILGVFKSKMIREKCFIAHLKHFQTLLAFYFLKPVHRPPTIFSVEIALAHIWKWIQRGIYSLQVQLGGGVFWHSVLVLGSSMAFNCCSIAMLKTKFNCIICVWHGSNIIILETISH